MDEIAVIAGGLDAAPPSLEDERRARDRLLAHIDNVPRRRFWSAGRVLLVAAVLLVLVAGTALAVGPLGVFRGTPAPKSVQTRIGSVGFVPRGVKGIDSLDVRASQATGLFAVRLGTGKVLAWSAPLADGGRCLFFQPVGIRAVSYWQFGPCEAPRMTQTPVVYAAYRFSEYYPWLISGRVSDRVARLVAIYPHHREGNVRIVERFFAVQYPWTLVRRPVPSALVAYDSSGRVLERAPVPAFPSYPPIAEPSTFAGMKGLLAAEAGGGAPAYFVLTGRDRLCDQALTPPRSRFEAFCLTGGTGGPPETETGVAAGSVASVRARLADGSTRPVLRLDGHFMYAWSSPRLRPVAFVAADKSGRVIAVRREPVFTPPPPPARAGPGTGCASCSGLPALHAPGGAVLTLDRSMGDARLGEERAGVDRAFGRGRILSRAGGRTRLAYRGGLLIVTYVAGRVELLETRSTRYRTWSRVGVGTAADKMLDRLDGVQCTPGGTECRHGFAGRSLPGTTFRLDRPDGKIVSIAIATGH